MSIIYLDNNATTKVADEVIEEMLPYHGNLYGNPSSMHTFGGQIHRRIEDARERVAELINADPEEILFTSCGTESDNTAVMSALLSNTEKKHIITTKVEHPAILNFCKTMERRGYKVTFLPVDILGIVFLYVSRVGEHDGSQVPRREGAENQPAETLLHRSREVAGVIYMGM